MKRSPLTPRRLLAVVVVMLLIASFLGETVAANIAHAPRVLVGTALNPLTHPLYTLSRNVRGGSADTHAFSEDRKSRQELEEELGHALRRLDRLRQEHEQLQREFSQVTRTREQLGLSGVRLVRARVTAYGGDPAAPVLTINRGTQTGITRGTVVVSGFNLVGEVVHAGPMTANVRLITAPGTEFRVTLRPPEAEDTQRQTDVHIEARSDGGTFGVQVSARSEIEVGDFAHLSDPRWPREARGFVAGQVRSVEPTPDDPHVFRDVVIDPIPPLSALPELTALVPAE